jgi:hypothetical protein
MENTDNCCDDVCRLPWIRPFTPGESNQKYRKTACEENEADIVKARQLLPFRPVLMQKVKCWRVVKEEEQEDRKTCDDDVQVVRPSPSGCGMSDERLGNDWSEAGNLERGEEDADNPQRPVLVWNKLGDCNCKRYLDGASQSTEEIATNEVVHTVRSGSDYSANQSKGVADNKEPAPSENI